MMKAIVYHIIYIKNGDLNIARVFPRVEDGDHSAPRGKIRPGFRRYWKHQTVISLRNEVFEFNSSRFDDPFKRGLTILNVPANELSPS